ncbi:MAG: phosphonate ABC transporter, permease protein PhnE, partial [Nitrospinota bacterium]|nr:phosphonate ABC transporter, permease protein PhnE [Nitrospinota bacterium]
MPSDTTTEDLFRRPFYARSRFLVVVLIIGVVYSYGWRVTEIDIGELVHDFHLVKPLVTDLVHPDLVAANKQSVIVETPFLLGRSPSPLTKVEPPLDSLPVLQLSRQGGIIGDRLTVEGFNLQPNREGKLIWVNSIEQELPLAAIKTDPEGKFYQEIQVPGLARGEQQRIKVELTWKT